MKKTLKITKKIASIVTCAALVFSLAACGKENSAKKKGDAEYKDASEAVTYIKNNGGFENPDALVIRDADFTGAIFQSEIPSDFAYMSTDDGSADMAGVFVCDSSEQASNLNAAITSYIADMKAESDRYQPAEAAKLENAVILSEDNILALCVSEDSSKAEAAVKEVVANTDGGNGSSSDDDNNDDYSETEAKDAPSISSSGDFQDYGNGIVRSGDACYECWYYNSNNAERYADNVKKISNSMPSNVNVYNMLIPLSSSITMPDEDAAKAQIGDQPGAIEKVNALIGASAKHVNIYNTLRAHRDEYVYFRTDHHWTALGSYYAYAQFMSAVGKSASPISSYKTVQFDGFLGEFYTSTKSDKLAANPDTITAYYPINNDSIKMTITDSSGKSFAWPIINDVNSYGASVKYSTFAGADNPYTIIENSAVTDGSVCIVIKESFGNALVPFIADNYSTVYVIDYRYYTGNIMNLVPSSGRCDILFANNLSMLQNAYLIGKFETLANNCK